MPLEHGARGCTSFNKLFFMRHFREPIALQTTAMDQVDDGARRRRQRGRGACAPSPRRTSPQVIGLITTGLSETQGADIPRTIRGVSRSAIPQYGGMAIVPVSATDTLGCLETGFALAVEAIIAALVPAARRHCAGRVRSTCWPPPCSRPAISRRSRNGWRPSAFTARAARHRAIRWTAT